MTLGRVSSVIPPQGAYTSPGAMHRRVHFYTKGLRKNDGTYGDDALFKSSWAAVRPLTGREMDKSREMVQEVDVVITVPYIEGLEESMTVLTDDGDTYQIHYIIDPGRKVEQRCYAALVGQTQG